MKQKKSAAGLALGISVLFSSVQGFAGVIDFENVPQTYWYAAGGQNLGSYYDGVTFGTEATILENQVYGYYDGGYPPHSGHAVLFSISSPDITAQFSSPQESVSLWYTSNFDLTFSAYDSSNNLIGQSIGSPNIGSSSVLTVNVGTASIDHVVVSGSANYYTIDDFSTPGIGGNPVPEPSATLLIGFGIVGIGYAKRRKVFSMS